MGLSLHNIELMRLITLRDQDECELSLAANRKMRLTADQSNLTREYQAKLQSKHISYYADGKYNKMNYNYLMGNGVGTLAAMQLNPSSLKSDNSMILTDANGLVVLGSQYVSAMTKVLGTSCMNSKGRGGTFSADKIPALIAAIAGSPLTEENVKQVIDGGKLEYGYNVNNKNLLTQKITGSGYKDASDTYTSIVEKLTDFYYPIFRAAAANGWTTEYNKEMEQNDNYISDALVSNTFQLEQVNAEGGYAPDASLTYFTMTGLVSDRTDASIREEITAWYNAEKELINQKETMWDITIQDLSTRIEATKTEIETLKTMLEDDMKPLEWSA